MLSLNSYIWRRVERGAERDSNCKENFNLYFIKINSKENINWTTLSISISFFLSFFLSLSLPPLSLSLSLFLSLSLSPILYFSLNLFLIIFQTLLLFSLSDSICPPPSYSFTFSFSPLSLSILLYNINPDYHFPCSFSLSLSLSLCLSIYLSFSQSASTSNHSPKIEKFIKKQFHVKYRVDKAQRKEERANTYLFIYFRDTYFRDFFIITNFYWWGQMTTSLLTCTSFVIENHCTRNKVWAAQ